MTNETDNRLGNAVSPYLLQHKDNPVAWREWSPAALAEAETLDRPILLSIGYAACHWCHVMAHESFEDAETAALMNSLFVNVKVDREERPDIDHLYMSALQAMGEQGGWPMTMFLTPKSEPFFGGTYYPKRPSHGRPSFTQLLESVAGAWTGQRGKLQASADNLSAHLRGFLARAPSGEALPPDALTTAAATIGRMMDRERGGMTGAPKFPNAPYMELLARSAFVGGPAEHKDAFLLTLRGLCEGGIYDHLGGGLHRYSVDDVWLVPHFEKMLYDNAQFLRHLIWGWRATGLDLFRIRIEETVAWLSREMRVGEGAFAASLDADSLDADGHSEEGAFYVWNAAEIDALLGSRADAFKRRYDVGPAGNWEGKTILNRLGGVGERDDTFREERAILLAHREGRARPARDDKVLADWNGLTIRALAEIASVFGHETALDLAETAYDAVMDSLFKDGRLYHAARDGRVSGVALAGDYGALITAASALFVATLDPDYLEDAERLSHALDHWHGEESGGHLMTARDAADVLLPLRGDGDDAVPGSTALVLEGLALYAQVSGTTDAAGRADRAAEAAAARIASRPSAYPGILSALDRLSNGRELALVGDASDPALVELISVANRSVDLNRVDLLLDDPASLPASHPLRAFGEKRPAALLCRDQSCLPPIDDPQALEAALRL